MNLLIAKADKTNIDDAVALSKACQMNKRGGELGIFTPIEKQDLKHIFVALYDGKVVGALKAEKLTDEARVWFDAQKDKSPALFIQKLCVEKQQRGKHIASEMIKFVKANNPISNIYADILFCPIKNEPSIKTFLSNGFMKYAEKVWIDGLTYGMFKYSAKLEN